MVLSPSTSLSLLDWTYLKQIYLLSFPKDEQRPWSLICHPEDSAFTLWAIRDEDSEVVGMATLWDLDGLTYIEHLAISPERRGEGLGRRFFRELERRGIEHIVLEAEPEEVGFMARRRLAFYRRLGFLPQPYPYLQPPYTEEGRWVRLHLLSNKPLTEEEFEAIRSLLYRRVYRYSSC